MQTRGRERGRERARREHERESMVQDSFLEA
jgi:hypothetical protein